METSQTKSRQRKKATLVDAEPEPVTILEPEKKRGRKLKILTETCPAMPVEHVEPVEPVEKPKRGRSPKVKSETIPVVQVDVEPVEKPKRVRSPKVKSETIPVVQVKPRGRPKTRPDGDSYNKSYYQDNKESIAKKRLLRKIENGGNVSNKLLIKYGLVEQ